MMKFTLSILLSICFLSLHAQKFAAASQGYFSNTAPSKLLTLDSSEQSLMYDLESVDYEIIPESLTFINNDGDTIEIEASEILFLEIPRGEVPESEVEIIEMDDEISGKIISTSEMTPTLIYERVRIDHKKGDPVSGKYQEDTYLLQLASQGMGDRLKVYIAPNFEDDASELAPLGYTDMELSRNRVDYDEFEVYYYIKIADEPAFRINSYDFLEYTPIMFGDNRVFRRKYKVAKLMDGDRTKKRKKTTRKAVGNKKKRASTMNYSELNLLVKDYHKLYVQMLEEDEAKRLAREAEKN